MKIMIVIFLILLYHLVFAVDYPWNKLKRVNIEIEIESGLDLENSKTICKCNCAQDSGFNSSSSKYRSTANDYDTCFWKQILNNSNPSFRNDYIGNLMCCEPPQLSIWIKFICEEDTFSSKISTFKQKSISFSTKNGGWEFKLEPKQMNLLYSRLEKIINSGFKKLKNNL